jgi:GH43 family beta-xylosidase
MHLAILDGGTYKALNHNSGVLFAKATENGNGSLNAKSLRDPYLFQLKDGRFGVLAVRTETDGSPDIESRGKLLLCVSDDLLQYNECGLMNLKADVFPQNIVCCYDQTKQKYAVYWSDDGGKWYASELIDIFDLEGASKPVAADAHCIPEVEADIEGIVPRNTIPVPENIWKRLKFKLSVPENVAVMLPDEVYVSSAAELRNVKAVAVYNDGTTASKTVNWVMDAIDWNRAGTYEITGTVHQDHFSFPIALNRADPCITKWNGRYYFIATNDADNNHTLYMREANSIPGLVNAKETLILDSDSYDHIKGLLWAPEFHVVNKELYIFHAATPSEFFYEESHVMKLRNGGNPMCAADWLMPQRVVKKDGTYLCEAGKTISLDMTNFEWDGEYYVIWSQREFLPVDLGAWLYIAKVDPKEPWKLITDPVLLSKPEYGWENNHTFVDEGPFTLITNKKIFLTFASAAIDETYVVGLLSADRGANLMNPGQWTKGNYPFLTSRSIEGEFGTGHSSFFTDDDTTWLAYHAKPGVGGPRSSGLRRVHFDIDGYPVLDLPEEKDLKKEYQNVMIKATVR